MGLPRSIGSDTRRRRAEKRGAGARRAALAEATDPRAVFASTLRAIVSVSGAPLVPVLMRSCTLRVPGVV